MGAAIVADSTAVGAESKSVWKQGRDWHGVVNYERWASPKVICPCRPQQLTARTAEARRRRLAGKSQAMTTATERRCSVIKSGSQGPARAGGFFAARGDAPMPLRCFFFNGADYSHHAAR